MGELRELSVSGCLLPVVRLMQEWVDAGRWGSVTVTFQRGAPLVCTPAPTLKLPPAAASSGRTIRVTEREDSGDGH